MAESADFFLRTPTLIASNFAALWPTDQKFLAYKDLLFFSQFIEFRGAGKILKVDFAQSKWPYFYRVYLLSIRKQSSMAELTLSLVNWLRNHPSLEQDLSLKIEERDQTIWICMLEL